MAEEEEAMALAAVAMATRLHPALHQPLPARRSVVAVAAAV